MAGLLSLLLVALILGCAEHGVDDRIAESLVRVHVYQGDMMRFGGTAVMTSRGLLTASHIVEEVGQPFGRKGRTLGYTTAYVIDAMGRKHSITSMTQFGSTDVTRLVCPTLRLRPIAIGAPPKSGDKVRSVGFFFKAHDAGKLSRPLSVGEGVYERIHIHVGHRGYPYSGLILLVSAPLNSGMSGGALLDSTNRIIGIISYYTSYGNGCSAIPHEDVDTPANGK